MHSLWLVICVIILIAMILSNLSLWGENIWLRMYNHQIVKTWYNPNNKPFIRVGSVIPRDIHDKARNIAGLCCSLKTSHLNDAYRAFNADNKGGAIYWNDIKPFAEENMELYDEIRSVQRFAQDFAENESGKVLYPFEFSMWNVFVLKYTGKKGSFDWHYDSESPEDYRVLICVRRTPQSGIVEYYDDRGRVQHIDLQEGQPYLLRGSTTYHRVTLNANDDDERFMLGFHFSETPNKITKNLCYFSALTKWRLNDVLSVWWNQHDY